MGPLRSRRDVVRPDPSVRTAGTNRRGVPGSGNGGGGTGVGGRKPLPDSNSRSRGENATKERGSLVKASRQWWPDLDTSGHNFVGLGTDGWPELARLTVANPTRGERLGLWSAHSRRLRRDPGQCDTVNRRFVSTYRHAQHSRYLPRQPSRRGPRVAGPECNHVTRLHVFLRILRGPITTPACDG